MSDLETRIAFGGKFFIHELAHEETISSGSYGDVKMKGQNVRVSLHRGRVTIEVKSGDEWLVHEDYEADK